MRISSPFLKKGDKVILVSTARKVVFEDLLPAIGILKEWGLDVAFAPKIFHIHHQFAGTDEERISDLQYAIDSDEYKAVICVRGGYGTVRIIDQIDFSGFKQSPKWITGFSDVTVLHNHLQKIGICSIHSSMPLLFAKAEVETLATMRKALFGEELHHTAETHHFNRAGEASGEVVGGNLSILVSMVGTPSDINTSGCILFIEDLDEYLYHIDRMMMQLKRAGKLNSLAGLVVGHMSDMHDNAVPFGKSAYEIIRDAVAEYDYPVIFGFPVGHENDNLAMVCGQEASLKVTDVIVTLKFM